MGTNTKTIVTTKPAAMALDDAAAYISLSTSLLQKQAQTDPTFPKPVQLSIRRVGWLTSELDEWLATRPRSSCAPPAGSGYGRKGKPQTVSS